MEKGHHLLFEAVTQRLLEKSDLEAFLQECPRRIRMSIISGPNVCKTDSGWAGIVLIAESHISVHTDGLELFCDVFSCIEFSTRTVMELAREMLALEHRPKPRIMELRRGWSTRSQGALA